MKQLYTNPDPAWVQYLCDILVQNNIIAMVKNTPLSGGVGELPPTETWPELWVMNENQIDHAKLILAEHTEQAVNPVSWRCTECNEQCDGQFTDCWNCGKHQPI